MDNSIINSNKSGYENMVMNPDYRAALCPQLLYALKSQAVNPRADSSKNDVWAIGMTALCMGSIQDFNIFYDWKNYRIRYEKIMRAYDLMRQKGYSETLVKLIETMLQETERQRAIMSELHEYLNSIEIEDENLDIKEDPQHDPRFSKTISNFNNPLNSQSNINSQSNYHNFDYSKNVSQAGKFNYLQSGLYNDNKIRNIPPNTKNMPLDNYNNTQNSYLANRNSILQQGL